MKEYTRLCKDLWDSEAVSKERGLLLFEHVVNGIDEKTFSHGYDTDGIGSLLFTSNGNKYQLDFCGCRTYSCCYEDVYAFELSVCGSKKDCKLGRLKIAKELLSFDSDELIEKYFAVFVEFVNKEIVEQKVYKIKNLIEEIEDRKSLYHIQQKVEDKLASDVGTKEYVIGKSIYVTDNILYCVKAEIGILLSTISRFIIEENDDKLLIKIYYSKSGFVYTAFTIKKPKRIGVDDILKLLNDLLN